MTEISSSYNFPNAANTPSQPATPPPPSSSTANTTIEKGNLAHLAKAELELSELIRKKKQLDKDLVNLESNLYALETTYLEDTAGFGNIIRGFDQYLRGTVDKRRGTRLQEKDRIFSQSSTTLPRSLEIKERENPDYIAASDDEASVYKKRDDNDGTFHVDVDRKRKRN